MFNAVPFSPAARHSSFVINAAGWPGCNSVTATPPVAIARVKLIKLERPFEPRPWPGTDSSRMTLISRGSIFETKQGGEGYA